MTIDALRAAHDAGYLHGLIAGGLLFGFVGLVSGATAMLMWLVPRDALPPRDPADGNREDRAALRDELPPELPRFNCAGDVVMPPKLELWR